MKHKSLVKALEKAGFTIGRPFYDTDRSDAFRVQNGENILSWYTQGDSAICVHACTVKQAQEKDLLSDYHPGFFCRTIKSAISSLGAPEPFPVLAPHELETDLSEIIF